MKTGKEKNEHQTQPDYDAEFGIPTPTFNWMLSLNAKSRRV